MNPGILAALGAYVCWGLLPIYWKLLAHVPAPELLSHRIVWSFVALALFLLVSKRLGALRRTLSPAIWRIYFWAAALVGVNWFIYVWSVNAGYIVEASLGYFITPLLSVFLGIFFSGNACADCNGYHLYWPAQGCCTLQSAMAACPGLP